MRPALKSVKSFKPRLIFERNLIFKKTIVIAYLRQKLSDFQKLSLFRKIMKILTNLRYWYRISSSAAPENVI